MLPPDSAAHHLENLAGLVLHVGPERGCASDTIAGLPDDENENRDQPNDNGHPVLAFETQKGKMLS